MDALRGLLKTCAGAVVLSMAIASSSCQTKREPNAVVRPCSVQDWQLAQSPEAKKLTKDGLESMGGYSSCETAVLPFLPDAHILRLHTPVHVDYSLTATLLQAKMGATLRLVSSGRGMVQHPRPDGADSISALNYLLNGVKLRTDPETIRSLSDLYFFILDGESSPNPVGQIVQHEEPLDKDPSKISVAIDERLARVTYVGRIWSLTFELSDGEIRLASVKSTDL